MVPSATLHRSQATVHESVEVPVTQVAGLPEQSTAGGPADESPPLLNLIETRHCTHSFNPDRAVPGPVIHSILRAARNCPSTNNTQPWTTIVAQGERRDALVAGMLAKFDAGDDGSASYKNRPAEMNDRMKQAALRYGKEFYGGYFNLERDDKAARRACYRGNYEFWGAPVHMIVCCPADAVAGTYLDMGSFMTSILLSAHAHGLGAKPQFSVAKYHDVCRQVLGETVLPPCLQVVCGISIGWTADGSDPRAGSSFFPTRLAVDETTTWAVDADYIQE